MSRVTDTDEGERLTEAGWPRPRYDGWPVPWVSPQGELAKMNGGRLDACASGAVCAVCGLGYQLDERAVAFVRVDRAGETAPDGWDAGEVLPMDNAVMHARCARLAYSTCPALLQIRTDGLLLPVDVPVNAAAVELVDEDGATRVRAVLDAAECRPLPLPETEWPA